MDIQVVLVIILFILTVNLVVVGVYLVLVLKDLRQTLQKANNVLTDVESVTHIVSNPLATITTLISYVLKGFKSTKPVSSLIDFSDEEEE